jgi:hypothetical protein
MAKHYIRIDNNNTIIHNFSTSFEKPLEGDICINESAPRKFFLDKYDENKKLKLKWDKVNKKIIDRTEAEIYPETKAIFKANQAKLMNAVSEDIKEIIDILIAKTNLTIDDLSINLKTRYTNRS